MKNNNINNNINNNFEKEMKKREKEILNKYGSSKMINNNYDNKYNYL
jgi:hypothetical protein